MERFTRQTRRFFCQGIDLNNPFDAILDNHYPILENLRSYQAGTIQPRPGLIDIGAVIAGQTPLHTVRRLNDPINATWARIFGAGTALSYGQALFTRATYDSANVAFSGDPLAMVPYRPDQSPDSWMYITDSLAMYKINRAGTVHKIGVAPPTAAPSTTLAAFIYAGLLNFQSTAGWTIDGTTFTTAVGTAARVDSAITTTTRVLYDSGFTGWACVVLPSAAMSVTGIGALLDITVGGIPTTMLVHEIYQGSNTVKVANIIYDNTPTNTGTCTIQPDQPVKEIQPNSVVLLNGATYARVLSVVQGLDESVSFRCSTGATTIASAQNLQIVGSVRIYDPGALLNSSGDTVGQLALTTGGGAVPGDGWLNQNAALDLTKIPVSGNGGAVQNDDYLHLSLKISDLSLVTQGRIFFNCDIEATPTYTKNYYYLDFRPNDLIRSVKGTQTALDNRNTIIQNRQTDNGLIPFRQGPFLNEAESGSQNADQVPLSEVPDPSSINPNNPSPGSQLGTGDNQWLELIFRRGDLIRVGSDVARGFANINGFRLQLSITGVITLAVNSLDVWGTFPLDMGELGTPYYYRYRYRVSNTGAASNWSPPQLLGLPAKRQNAVVNCTASTAPEVDKIDIQRWGGTATEWLYIGTATNSAHVFTDTATDITARNNAALSEDDVHYMPWPVTDVPKSGTTAASGVAGTMVKDSGTSFNTAWAKGTGIRVGGLDTTIRRVLSTSLVEVTDSLGSQTSTTWEIPEPLLAGQPLPALWGPWNGRSFACGDTRNPGTVYISNGNDFDSTQEFLKLEITASSEPLVNGCTFNGRNYVFSTERMFEINEIEPNVFVYSEVPNGKGLWSRWALTVGTRIFFLSKDGIYETEGGGPTSITDPTLYPLFPNEGNLGIAVNGFFPPNMVSGQETKFRLSYYDNYLYFDYVDTESNRRTLVYTADAERRGWFPDVYSPGITYHYGEEGQGVHSILCCGADAVTGRLYQLSGTADGSSTIPWHLRTMGMDADERRADKLWGDLIVDLNTGGSNVTAAVGINNYSSTTTISPTTLNTVSRGQLIVDFLSGNGVEAKNISLDLTGASTTATPKLYLWEPSFIARPENSKLRLAEWNDLEIPQDKFWQGFYLEADTGGTNRSIQVIKDDGTVAETFTVNHAFRQEKPYSYATPFTSYMVKMLPTDVNQWKLYNVRHIAQPEPPLTTNWISQQTSFGFDGYWHMREMWITLTNTATVTLTITRMEDGTTWSYTIPAGTRKKNYIVTGPIKAKGVTFSLTSIANFRTYQEDIAVMVKRWGIGSAFHKVNPFGDKHGNGAAPI